MRVKASSQAEFRMQKNLGGAPRGAVTDPQFVVVLCVWILVKYVKKAFLSISGGGVPPTPQIATDMWTFGCTMQEKKQSLECKKNLGGAPTEGGTNPQFFVVLWVRILVKYVKNSIFGQKNFWGLGAPYPPPK